MRVSVENGKYTYVITETNAHVLRYGKLWKDATGDKFTYSMAAEIESLREQVEKLTKEWDIKEHCITQFELEDLRMQEQLAALAEQNENMRETLQELYELLPVGVGIAALSLPDLATPLVSEYQKDAELLDYIQNHGATIQIVPMANRTFGFEVGGLHKSRKLSVREAIDAAMQEDKP